MYYFWVILFFIFLFIIFWGMIGFTLSMKFLDKVFKNRKLIKNYENEFTVTLMIVAHNEEKVIKKKLENAISLDYPKEKLEILVTSDNSTDKTNDIVKNFINENKKFNIRLYEAKERKGKTNAQNEAQKTVESEILIMTDANSILNKEAIRELVSSFSSPDISYVTGKLELINEEVSEVSNSEKKYWNIDLFVRYVESKIQTITGGNGALYACRNSEYYDFAPIESHDNAMPLYFALKGKRAIVNYEAIAYEKAGEVIEDEFSRKVRMNRSMLYRTLPDIRILNIFKYRWFTYFYLGHRTCRYLLWISHLIIMISNIALAFYSPIFLGILVLQILFYLLALIGKIFKKNKIINLCYYYVITIMAQWVGVFNIMTGKAKPFWEKAESTR